MHPLTHPHTPPTHTRPHGRMFSPPLRRDVAFFIHHKMLEDVPMFKNAGKGFLVELADSLKMVTYGRDPPAPFPRAICPLAHGYVSRPF